MNCCTRRLSSELTFLLTTIKLNMGISNEDSIFASFSECPISPFEGDPT